MKVLENILCGRVRPPTPPAPWENEAEDGEDERDSRREKRRKGLRLQAILASK